MCKMDVVNGNQQKLPEEFDEDDFILNEPRWRAGLVPMVSVSYKCLTL